MHSRGISVVIPTYRRPAMTIECIRSVISAFDGSKYVLEIIVGENPSENQLPDELSALLHRKVTLYKWSTNEGPFNNWHKCVKKAKYPVTLLLFSDDLLKKMELDFDSYDEIASGRVPYSVCKASVHRLSSKKAASTKDIFVNLKTSDRRALLEGFLGGSTGYPVSPAASFFNTRTLDFAFNDYRGRFAFGLDNGAGPDLYAYIYPLVHYHTAIPSRNNSVVVFRAHDDSFTSNPVTAVRVMANYSALRLILIKTLDEFGSFRRLKLEMGIFYLVGSWHYRHSRELFVIVNNMLSERSSAVHPFMLVPLFAGILRAILRTAISVIFNLRWLKTGRSKGGTYR